MSAHQDKLSLKGRNWLESVLKRKAQPQRMEGSCQRKETQVQTKTELGRELVKPTLLPGRQLGWSVSNTQPIFVPSFLPFIKSRRDLMEPETQEPLCYQEGSLLHLRSSSHNKTCLLWKQIKVNDPNEFCHQQGLIPSPSPVYLFFSLLSSLPC